MSTTPTIGETLEQAGETTLDRLPVIVKALRVAGLITPIYLEETASQFKEKLALNEPEVLDLTVGELLKGNSKTKEYQAITWIMTICLAVMALSVMGSNVYIAFTTGRILGWEDIILPFVGPLLVVWHERGITLKENRDMLNAVMGKSPSSTIMESVASRIRNPTPKVVEAEYKETFEPTDEDRPPKLRDIENR